MSHFGYRLGREARIFGAKIKLAYRRLPGMAVVGANLLADVATVEMSMQVDILIEIAPVLNSQIREAAAAINRPVVAYSPSGALRNTMATATAISRDRLDWTESYS